MSGVVLSSIDRFAIGADHEIENRYATFVGVRTVFVPGPSNPLPVLDAFTVIAGRSVNCSRGRDHAGGASAFAAQFPVLQRVLQRSARLGVC